MANNCLIQDGNDTVCDLSDLDSVKETIDDPAWSGFKLTVMVVGTLMQTIGNWMLVSIWSYQMYGGDPKKRTVMNRLGNNLIIHCLGVNLTSMATLMLRLLYGPLPPLLIEATFFVSNSTFGIASLLSLDAVAILRLSSLFMWKGLPPINEDFFGSFFFWNNLVIGFLYAVWEKLGNRQSHEIYFVLTGELLRSNSYDPNFRFFGIPMMATLLIYTTYGVASRLYKIKAWVEDRNRVIPINIIQDPSKTRDPDSNGRSYNNYNDVDIINIFINVMGVLAILTIYLVPILMDWEGDVIPPAVLGILVPMFIMTFVVPLKTFLQNREIWVYVKTNCIEEIGAKMDLEL